MSKPALLVVNKMDLPDAEDKLQELKEHLQNPDGTSDVCLFVYNYFYSLSYYRHADFFQGLIRCHSVMLDQITSNNIYIFITVYYHWSN